MSEETPDPAAPEQAPGAPPFRQYVALNVGVWLFLGAMAFVLIQALGSTRGIILLGLFLAGGFTAASIFDYLWLRWSRRGD